MFEELSIGETLTSETLVERMRSAAFARRKRKFVRSGKVSNVLGISNGA